jgi:putative Mn2+ efflux pump MntP
MEVGTIGTLVVLGIVIGSNNLAVALALGAHGQEQRRTRIALVFGGFEFAVPLVGIWLGATTAARIGSSAGAIGAALLIAIGGWTLVSGIRGHTDDERIADRVTTLPGLVALAAGLSIDNLLVGFSLGLDNADPLAVASTIAVFAVGFTLAGITLGAKSAQHWEQAAKIGSGVLLTGLGVATATGMM